jgi:plastocyanin
MSTRRSSLIAVLVLPIVLLLSFVTVGIANARTTHADHVGPAIDRPTITIHSFSYSVPASVQHGVLVNVVNKDSVHHTVTSNKAGAFSVAIPAHSTRSFRAPSTPQKYGFHCNFHSSMSGVLKVR